MQLNSFKTIFQMEKINLLEIKNQISMNTWSLCNRLVKLAKLKVNKKLRLIQNNMGKMFGKKILIVQLLYNFLIDNKHQNLNPQIGVKNK